MEIKDVTRKLVGPFNPVGETNADNLRFENLKVMTDLIDDLIEGVIDVSRGRDRHEHSIKKAGEFAKKFLDHVRETIEDEDR